jgi:predicted Fe-Mo cluster-binding NifX family protein
LGRAGFEENVGRHFDRVPIYTIYDSETNEMKFIPGSMVYQFGLRTLARMLSRAGVEVMIVVDMDADTADIFRRVGVAIHCGADGTVKDSIDACLARMGEVPVDRHHPEHAILITAEG